MVEVDPNEKVFSEVISFSGYNAIGIGPGIGTETPTKRAMELLVSQVNQSLVIDADGINILAGNKSLLSELSDGSILTPHLKEFERLFGPSESHFDRVSKLRVACQQYNLHIILKGAHTAIGTPSGDVYFNSTGNPGMATAGSGDVLLGIVTSLLAQGYSSLNACLLGVYIHGLAGDLAVVKTGEIGMVASDIIENLGIAYEKLCKKSDISR